jgi:hypothetical protein
MIFFGIDFFTGFAGGGYISDTLTYVSALTGSAKITFPLLFLKAEGWEGSALRPDKRFKWPKYSQTHEISIFSYSVEIDAARINIENGGAAGDPPYPPACDWGPYKILGHYIWKKTQCRGDGLQALEDYKSDILNKYKPWQSVVAVLSVLPLEEILTLGADKIRALTPFPDLQSEELKPHERIALEKAQSKLNALSAEGIEILARSLTHKNSDSVMEWGQQIEDLQSEYLSARAREIRQNSFHAQNKIDRPREELKILLEAARTGRLRRAFIEFRLSVYGFSPAPRSAAFKRLETKTLSFDTRMTRALDVLIEMEKASKLDIAASRARQAFCSETQEQIEIYKTLLIAYKDSLIAQRQRLILDQARDFQSGKDKDSLAAQFSGVFSTIKDDIDTRLHQLAQSIYVLEVELGSYEDMKNNERVLQSSLDAVYRQRVPLFREQLLHAQNIKLGHETVKADSLAVGLRKLTGQRLQDAGAAQVIDGVCNEVKTIEAEIAGLKKQEALTLAKADMPKLLEYKPEMPLLTVQRDISPVDGNDRDFD